MPSHYHFYSLACFFFNFYDTCSLVHATSLLIKWERAISEHAFLTLWAAAESSRLPSRYPNTQESFCSLLALKRMSSKQIMKTKRFPSPMISSPLDQPAERTHPEPHKSLDGISQAAELYPFTTKPTMSFANVSASPAGAELCCDTAPDIWKRSGKLESSHSCC